MGLGLGMSMQILILIVQNTFPVTEVGTATASNNYFRQIGASLGSAIVGSLFVAKLTQLLGERLPSGGTSAEGGNNSLTPAVVRDLPQALHDVIVGAYNDALTPVFLYMVPLVVVGLILLFFVVEKPLATTIERDILPESLEIDGGNWEIVDAPPRARFRHAVVRRRFPSCRRRFPGSPGGCPVRSWWPTASRPRRTAGSIPRRRAAPCTGTPG